MNTYFPNTKIIQTEDEITIFSDDITILNFQFYLKNDRIYIKIEDLNKTHYYSGSDIINNLEKYLQENYSSWKISLKDASFIYLKNFKLDLAILYIMMYGESWYENKGYNNLKNNNFHIPDSKITFDYNICLRWKNINTLKLKIISRIIYILIKNRNVSSNILALFTDILNFVKRNIKYNRLLEKLSS